MRKILILLALTVFMFACSKKEGVANTVTLRLGHNHTETNPSHIALVEFAKEVAEKSAGSMEIKIFSNSVLGDDRAMVEQTQQGVLDIVRVNSAILENFDKNFAVFSMPYLFTSQEKFDTAMRSETINRMYDGLVASANLRGLTFQDTSVRSFYTKGAPITTPADLAGKKIRVLNSQNSIKMIELLGGVATPMPYGEVYTALQQGIVDGAENNAQALTLDKHGEVAKFYSEDSHLRLPDFIVISEKTWAKLTPEQQEIIKVAAKNSTELHSGLVKKAMEDSAKEAVEKMGVTFNKVNIEEFKALVEPMYTELATSDPALTAIIKELRAY